MKRNIGFTLIELMIGLVVIATIAGTVLTRGSETVNQLFSIERRTVARWVVENEIERARLRRLTTDAPLPVGTTSTGIMLAHRNCKVMATTYQTSHPWLRRVDFTIFEIVDNTEVGPIDTVTAFIGRY